MRPAELALSRLPPSRLGRLAEGLSAAWLAAQGWRLVARNARLAGVEVDLVAWAGPCLVLVEVKARRSVQAGGPEEAVDRRKLRRLRRAALAWGAKLQAPQLRIDLLAWRWAPQLGWQAQRLEGI